MIWPFTKIKAITAMNEEAMASIDRFKLNETQLNEKIGRLALDRSYWESKALQLEKANGTIRDRATRLEQQIEIEGNRLTACGVAAMCNTTESLAHNRIDKGNPYYSAALSDVYRAVEREIKLRDDLQEANERSFRASEAHVVTMGNLEMALDRIKDLLKGDDGQAYKEAEKFYTAHRGTKICVICEAEMIPMHSTDKKMCSNGACEHEVDWPLEEGQSYQYKRNVEPFIEDRSDKTQEPPRSELQRL